MRASERERCVVVVERRACPAGRGVACVACGWESSRGVIGIRGSIPICLVAAVASRWQSCVVIVHVA